MSTFYGTLADWGTSDRTSTRCGHKSITAAARSYRGSIIVQLSGDTVDPTVSVSFGQGSTVTCSHTLFEGNLSDLGKHNAKLCLTSKARELVENDLGGTGVYPDEIAV